MFRQLHLLIVALLFSQPAFASVIWRGDFSNGTMSQWSSKEAVATDRLQVVTSPVPADMRYALKSTVVSGDSIYGGARAELDYETDRPAEGSERYYRWETYFPTDFQSAATWQLFTQWHQYISGGSPPMAFMAWGEQIQLGDENDHNFWTAPLVRGVWHEFIFHVIWSSDASKGRIEVWYDGQHVLAPTATATLFAGDTVYLKQGLYRKNTINYTQVIYHAGTVVGTTLADVTSAAAVSATVSPNPVAFGSVRVGSAATQKVVTVTNTGSSALNLNGYSLSGSGFSVSPASAATTIAAGQSATWTVTYNPTSAGASTGTLTFNTASSSLSTSLTGTAIFPKTSVSPTSVAFGSVTTGTTSSSQNVTVSNTGTDTLTISGLSLTGANASEFSFTAPSSLTVAAGQSAKIGVTFRPTQNASDTATLAFSTDNGAQSVSLTGTGAAAGAPVASLSPTTVAFGSFTAGSAPTSTVTISNTGNASLTVSGYTLGGTNASAFSVSPASTSTTIAAGSSKQWTVKAVSTSAGSYSATLSFTTNGGNVQAALSGTATTPAVPKIGTSVSSLSFGRIRIGASTSQSFTLSNTGNGAMTVSSLAFSGSNAGDFSTSVTAPLTVQPGASVTVPVVFRPSVAASESASLAIQSDGGSKTVSLSGTGVAHPLQANPNRVTFASQPVAKSTAPMVVTLQNDTTQSYRLLSYTFGGDNGGDFTFAQAATPLDLAGGESTSLSLVFTPAAMGLRSGTLAITTDDPSTTLEVSLAGNGLSPVMNVNPIALDFGSVDVGASGTATVTVANTGTAPLQILAETIVGSSAADFSLDVPFTATVSIAAGDSMAIPLHYAPGSGKTSLGTLVLTTDDPAQPTVSVPLSGEGLSHGISASATSMAFGTVRVGSPSDQQALTLTNVGNTSSQVALALTGEAAGDFTFTGVTGDSLTLAAGASTALTLGFTPTAHGDRTAVLTLSSAGTSVVVTLAGTGIQPGLNASPTTVAFGSVAVGSAAVTQTLSITNGGTAALHLGHPSIEATGGNVFSVAQPPAEIAVGETATLNVTFTPNTVGDFQGTLHLASSDVDGLTADIVLGGTVAAVTPDTSVDQPTHVGARAGCSSADGTLLALMGGLVALMLRRRKVVSA